MNPTPLRSLTRSAAVPSLRSARVIGRALGRPEMFRTHTPETTDGTNEVLRCSFCQKSQSDVRKLIAGPHVFICDEFRNRGFLCPGCVGEIEAAAAEG